MNQVAGDELADLDRSRASVTIDNRKVADLRVQRLDRLPEQNSFRKLKPTLNAKITPMISASVRSPTTAETTAATNSNNR